MVEPPPQLREGGAQPSLEKLDDATVPVEAILRKVPAAQLMKQYDVASFAGALEFLTLASIDQLETSAPSPFRLVAYLAGLLGPCLTQDERNLRSSQVQAQINFRITAVYLFGSPKCFQNITSHLSRAT